MHIGADDFATLGACFGDVFVCGFGFGFTTTTGFLVGLTSVDLLGLGLGLGDALGDADVTATGTTTGETSTLATTAADPIATAASSSPKAPSTRFLFIGKTLLFLFEGYRPKRK